MNEGQLRYDNNSADTVMHNWQMNYPIMFTMFTAILVADLHV